MALVIKSRAEIATMRESGRITALALEAVMRAVRPGVTTGELDKIAEDVIRTHGAVPAFVGYPSLARSNCPFPATITTSINDELVHGIPGRRQLKEGDILSIDCGCIHQGFVGDAAVTVGIGRVSAEAARLIKVTDEALRKGIELCVVGKRLGDISAAIQEHAESHGYNVVKEYTGHGVGRRMHEDPQIPNWGRRKHGMALRPGMVFALEPMLMVGGPEVYVMPDAWTVVTKDHKLCAHCEHTLAITDAGPEILTLP